MEKIGIFCSASDNIDKMYFESASQIGKWMGQTGKTLIYGGASLGLMECIARAVKENGGKVIGVVPAKLEENGKVSTLLDEEIHTRNLSDRKDIITEKSEVLVALPGGVGTLDEIFHVIAAASIGYHQKKVIFYNEHGFYDELLKALHTLEDKGFARQPFSTYYEVANTLNELKEKINLSYMIDSIKQLLQQEAQAVLNIPVTDAYEKAVKLIVEQIHQKKGKLVTSGMGKAGQIAMNIATTFCSTGIPSVFLHPSEAQHGDLGILQKNDLLLLISNSGKTREIVELTRLAHNLDPDLKFIVITGNPDSPLAKESDVCLSTGKPAEVCVLGMTPTTSTTAMTVIGDILVVQTMKETGFTIAEYSKRHHGGYLGEKSRSLCEK